MKTGILGVMAVSVASVVFSGCADEHDGHHHVAVYRTGYDTEPVLVERRTVVVDNARRTVPIYRTGNNYYYTYGGRRYTYDYDGAVRTRVVSRPGYVTTYDDGRVSRRGSNTAIDDDVAISGYTNPSPANVDPIAERTVVDADGRRVVNTRRVRTAY